jgi:hypothetical protein
MVKHNSKINDDNNLRMAYKFLPLLYLGFWIALEQLISVIARHKNSV